MPEASTQSAPSSETSVKETVTSVVIAFIVAFVFRGFVVEPFLIPTGSMAPTLMGAHMRFTSPETGYSWPVGPWDYLDFAAQVTKPVQGGGRDGPIVVTDPMSRVTQTRANVPRRAGDRIFVLKSVYSFFDPKRFDVVVFKCPFSPQENYIKRLIGLPGEQIALVDGDVFVRKDDGFESGTTGSPDAWSQPGWSIARKPERVQRAVWQPVFDTQYTPLQALRGQARFVSPWIGGAGWKTEGTLEYAYADAGPTTLDWDAQRWPIRDAYPYDETGQANLRVAGRASPQMLFYPVSDVRVSFAVKPAAPGLDTAVRLTARGHEFEARIHGAEVTLAMRRIDPAAPAAPDDSGWTTLGSGALREPLEPGVYTVVDFWHADQSVQVWVAGERVAHGEYDWTPAQRFEFASGRSVQSVVGQALPGGENALVDDKALTPPRISLRFSGGPVSLTRIAVSRDLHYQPASPNRQLARGADPRLMPTLTNEQFFFCGDNSPASLDGRLWTSVDPWVMEQVDPAIGVVNRDLLVGKAFFVYFPAPIPTSRAWVPDVGRLRFIW